MSHSDNDQPFAGEGDHQGNFPWRERDWKGFLQRHQEEVERFRALYELRKDRTSHLDEIAHEMGWDAADFAPSAEEDDSLDVASQDLPDEELEDDDGDPYTLHRHPVFVVVRGLYQSLRSDWEEFQELNHERLPARFAWGYANLLAAGECNSILAVQCLDMGDFGLCVCHLKMSLTDINRTLALLNVLGEVELQGQAKMVGESRLRLFDLRELYLRVMGECRAEIRRSAGDHENPNA